MIPTNGKILQGFSVSANKFQGVTTLAQIEDYGLIRPTTIDKKRSGLSSQEVAAHELHSVTNRTFDKTRLQNAEDYSGYIERVEIHNHPGGTPAITLYHRNALEMTEEGLVIPYGAALVAIDGETQTEARFLLADQERQPESKNNPIAVTLYHGIAPETAMQILHDYNTKGVSWTETKAARFNHTGQLSKAAQEAIEKSGVEREKINYRGPKGGKKHTVALQQILTGTVGYMLNGAGIGKSITANDFKRFNDASAPAVPPTCIDHMAKIISDSRNYTLIGHAPALLWQVAGVLLSRNMQPSQINWQGGMDAYNATKSAGRGGPRIPIKERLSKIESAMRL